MKVNVNDFGEQLIKEMTEYKNLVSSDLKDIIQDNVKQGVDTLRKTSPVAKKGNKKGRYAKGWKSTNKKQTANSLTVIIHNKTDYQVTHLLENGHAIVNGGRTVGSSPPNPHILKVQDQVEKQIETDIKRRLAK